VRETSQTSDHVLLDSSCHTREKEKDIPSCSATKKKKKDSMEMAMMKQAVKWFQSWSRR